MLSIRGKCSDFGKVSGFFCPAFVVARLDVLTGLATRIPKGSSRLISTSATIEVRYLARHSTCWITTAPQHQTWLTIATEMFHSEINPNPALIQKYTASLRKLSLICGSKKVYVVVNTVKYMNGSVHIKNSYRSIYPPANLPLSRWIIGFQYAWK